MRGRVILVAAAVVAALAGCGGGGGSPSAPTPSPSPQRTLIAQGSQSGIEPASTGVVYFLVFTAPANAVLEATVDWTSASNQIVLAWAQGDCTLDPNCSPLVQDVSTAKPKTLRTPSNLAAGNYTLAIANLGSTNESVSVQVFAVH